MSLSPLSFSHRRRRWLGRQEQQQGHQQLGLEPVELPRYDNEDESYDCDNNHGYDNPKPFSLHTTAL